MKNSNWEKYVKARAEQEAEEAADFASGKPGWYGDYFYEMENGVMTKKESIFENDPLNYPD